MISFRYKEKDTAIHKLNPLCKLAWVTSISIIALILNHPFYLCLLFLSTLAMVAAARIWREWSSLMKFALYLCLAITVINVLVSYHGSHVIWQAPLRIPVLGYPEVTLEALLFGVGMSLRLLTIISAFAVITLTVHPDDIMQAMLKLKIPYKSVLVASLATRFIPTLIDDAERISDVQRSRGLELDRGNLIRRIKSRTAVIVPLLSNSLDRTVQLAEAMEAKAFGSGEKRGFYKRINLDRLDILVLVSGFLPLVFGSLIRWWGLADYQYFPTLEGITFSSLAWSILGMLLFISVLIVPLALIKERLEFD